MSKVSKELLEFKEMIMKEDLEFYSNEQIENLNIIRKFCLEVIKQIKGNYNQGFNSIRLILSKRKRENFQFSLIIC